MRWTVFCAVILLLPVSLVRANNPAATQPARAVVDVRMMGSREALAGAKVSWETDGGLKGSGQTSASGEYTIDGISNQCKWVVVRVSRDGMVPLAIYWNRNAGDQSAPIALPPFNFLMEKATRISGHVLDEAGKPIVGAIVYINTRKKYEGTAQEPDLNWHSTTTDSQGLWSFSGMPAEPDRLKIGVYERMHLIAEYFDTDEYKPRSALWDGTARLTLPTGIPIEVSVLKPDGTPAAGAEIFFGRDHNVVNCIAPVKADADGKAYFGCKPGMASLLTASLAGYGPVQDAISVEAQPKRVTLKLTDARERTIEVVDHGGKPVRGATIDVSAWHGSRVMDVELDTDSAGRAVWKESPADDVTVTVYASGYTESRDIIWNADKPTRVVLLQPTDVTGIVVDAQNGEPINTYTIRAGSVWNEGERMVWQSFDWLSNDAKKEKGKFALQLTQNAYRYLLRVQADGYLPEDTELFDPEGSTKAFAFRLKRGEPVAGRIVASGNQPVAGAEVYVVDAGDWMGLQNGNVREGSENSCAHVKSGEDGRFILPPQKEDFALVVLSDLGTATLKRDEIAGKEPIIDLAPWAKVRGTIEVQGKPAGEIEVYGNSDPTTLGEDSQIVARQYYFKTDKDGTFELPRVIPGRLVLTRDVPNHSPGRMWYIALGSIDAKPGEIYDVKLGEGSAVTGKLLIPAGEQWMVRQSRLEPKGQPHAQNWENVQVMDDGSFRADGLSPGEYVLHVALHEYPPNNDCGWGRLVGEYETDVTIPNGIEKLDIGTLSPKRIPGPDLKAGDMAPDFDVKTLDGQTARLTDLKGKVVLVDFWAGWCAPCVAEIPNMQAIKSAHVGNGKFVMMGLSLDDQEEDVRGFVNRAKIDWPQAWVGIDSEPVKAYGATAIPATFLIGPDGRIVARDLRGEELKKAVEAALRPFAPSR